MGKKYTDFENVELEPNKYNLKPSDIRKFKVVDWDNLKKLCWRNTAMSKTKEWWCHLEGCQVPGHDYDDFDEFWIGFEEQSGKVSFHFTAYEGMCSYKFGTFYSPNSIENRFDMQVQINAMRFLNKLLDKGIVVLPD